MTEQERRLAAARAAAAPTHAPTQATSPPPPGDSPPLHPSARAAIMAGIREARERNPASPDGSPTVRRAVQPHAAAQNMAAPITNHVPAPTPTQEITFAEGATSQATANRQHAVIRSVDGIPAQDSEMNSALNHGAAVRLADSPQGRTAAQSVGPRSNQLAQTIERNHEEAMHEIILSLPSMVGGAVGSLATSAHGLAATISHFLSAVGTDVEIGAAAHEHSMSGIVHAVVGHALEVGAHGLGCLPLVNGFQAQLRAVGHLLLDGEERREAAVRDSEADRRREAGLVAGQQSSDQGFSDARLHPESIDWRRVRTDGDYARGVGHGNEATGVAPILQSTTNPASVPSSATPQAIPGQRSTPANATTSVPCPE